MYLQHSSLILRWWTKPYPNTDVQLGLPRTRYNTTSVFCWKRSRYHIARSTGPIKPSEMNPIIAAAALRLYQSSVTRRTYRAICGHWRSMVVELSIGKELCRAMNVMPRGHEIFWTRRRSWRTIHVIMIFPNLPCWTISMASWNDGRLKKSGSSNRRWYLGRILWSASLVAHYIQLWKQSIGGIQACQYHDSSCSVLDCFFQFGVPVVLNPPVCPSSFQPKRKAYPIDSSSSSSSRATYFECIFAWIFISIFAFIFTQRSRLWQRQNQRRRR